MPKATKVRDSTQVRRLRDALAREKANSAALARERKEAREQQAAAAEILKVISKSPDNAQPVFDAIVKRALRLMDGHSAIVTRAVDGMLHLAAHTSTSKAGDAALRKLYPRPIVPEVPHGRAILSRVATVVADTEKLPAVRTRSKELGRARGYRSLVVVPLLQGGVAIGTIGVARKEPGPFGKQELQLLETFAEQAVIAIENVQRFNETQEALEQQTATAEILKVISGSQADVQPVFDAIARRATRLIGGHSCAVWRYVDGAAALAAYTSTTRSGDAALKKIHLTPLAQSAVHRRVSRSKAPFFIADTEKPTREFSGLTVMGRVRGYRSMAIVPMLSGKAAIGGITVTRKQAGPFSKQEIDLLMTFAEQAVIAIENVRLFNETKKALERQTATAEILKVISSSPSDVRPVLDAVAASAARLCQAKDVSVLLKEGDQLRYMAHQGDIPTGAAIGQTKKISGDWTAGRAALEARPIHISDILAEPDMGEGARMGKQAGYRTVFATPLLRDGAVVGVIAMRRAEVRPFEDRQIQLINTFAEQAVIAIENVRLFNETKESLERQTATAEILKVIASSPSDVQPVFQVIVDSAKRLLDGRASAMALIVEGMLHLAAFNERDQASVDALKTFFPVSASRGVAGDAIRTLAPVNVADTETNPGIHESTREAARVRGFRSIVIAPLVRNGVAIGILNVTRTGPGEFSTHHLDLLKTFADQAVIAIENVRLFNETKESLERQTATAEILRVIARSPTDVQPVFEAIVQSAGRLFNRRAVLRLAEGDQLRRRALSDPSVAKFQGSELIPIDRGNLVGRACLAGRPMQVADTLAPDAVPYAKAHAREWNFRSNAAAPLMRDGKAIGSISVNSPEPGALTDKQMEVLGTFADQAVIAIENVRLFNETREALERQTATAEILKVISSSPTNIRPVLEAVCNSAARLCAANDVLIRLLEGDVLRAVAHVGPIPLPEEVLAPALSPDHMAGRAVIERRTIHVDDVTDPKVLQEYPAALSRAQKGRGFKSLLIVPLIRHEQGIGLISIRRVEKRPFSEQQISLLQSFADQAVIAIENVRLFNETKEALEQQTAISEVLRVISNSPADVQPVLEAVAVRAAKICDASDARIALVEGDHFRHVAGFGDLPPAALVFPLERGAPIGRAVIDRKTLYIRDIQAETGDDFALAREIAAKSGWRSNLVVPLMRTDRAVGAIALRRRDVRPFTPKQISLLQTFADQAVIAIENVRLFNETREGLERQTATSEVLKAISRTAFDLNSVLQVLIENATRLAGANQGFIFRYDGDSARLAYAYNAPQAYRDLIATTQFRAGRGSLVARTLLERRPVHIPDALADPEFTLHEAQRAGGFRSMFGVPMMRDGNLIGVIAMWTNEVRPFTEKQMELVSTFADQAVIAIENVRLFNETKEALEQQTAISEILRVMSDSPSDVSPVLKAVAQSAMRICESTDARIFVVDGSELRYAAGEGDVGSAEIGIRRPLSRGFVMGRAVIDRAPVHVEDLAAVSETEYPLGREIQRQFGHRTTLAVPLLREGNALGVILLRRNEVRPFAEKQISLLKTFADQAAIAIANVRLFNETKEALERQTATAEVLQVLSGSPSSLQPVFEAILANATRLCNSHLALLNLYQNGKFRTAAQFGGNPEFVRWVLERNAFLPSESITLTRMIETKQPIQAEDLKQSEAYRAGKGQTVNMVDIGGARTFLAVPLFKEDELLGNIGIYRPEVLPFTDKQIDLVRSFANQAVIAIENVRLFNETKEALERQIATADILKVIGSSPTDTQPVFEAIVQGGLKLFPEATIGVTRPNGARLEMVAIGSRDPALAEVTKARFPIPLTPDYLNSRAVLDARLIDLPDAEFEKDGPFAPGVRNFLATGNRAMTVMPMIRGDEAIGTISVTRATPGPLTDKQLSLLRIFADQAVIAIENVRLFNETKETLERQTATAEILKVIASSPTDVQPVFDSIVRSAIRLLNGISGGLCISDGAQAQMVAAARAEGVDGTSRFRADYPAPLDYKAPAVQAIRENRVFNVPELEEGDFAEAVLERAEGHYRSAIAVPMRRGDTAIGSISVTRQEPGLFPANQVELLQTFADQAVIAIENVRLFNETNETLERQTATAEILKVIASSPSDVQPVFDAIVDSAMRLLEGATAHMTRLENGVLHLVAFSKTTAGAAALHKLYPMTVAGTAVAEALERKSPIVVTDAETDSRLSDDVRMAARARGVRSFILVPLVSREVSLGTLVVNRRDAGNFSAHEIELLRTFADQAVIAIENVRLFQELEARTKALTRSVSQLTALGQVGQAISATLDLEKVLKTIAAHAVQLTGLDVATIYEFDEATAQFELRAWQNMPEDLIAVYRQMPLRLGEGVIGKAAALREPVQVPDIHDPGYQTRYRDLLIREGYRAILAVPMLREERIVGAITVSRSKPGEFPPEVVELLKTFATQSALAIQNARLFREIADKSRQLEEASKHKSQFLASMSHELRTPLNAILGFNEMLLGEVYGPLSEDMQPPLTQMQTSGKHLLRLINNVLDLAKIEAGRMELALSDYSVHDTVESVRATLRPLAEAKGLDFVVELPADLPLAHGDPGRITQCLMNLAGNSLKFTKEGKVAIQVDQRDSLLVYRVSDTGVGIPADKIGSLFTEFKQTDATIASEFGGTGLGLSISKKFIEMHGGRIWAESEPGRGSTFIFEIPLRAGEEGTA